VHPQYNHTELPSITIKSSHHDHTSNISHYTMSYLYTYSSYNHTSTHAMSSSHDSHATQSITPTIMYTYKTIEIVISFNPEKHYKLATQHSMLLLNAICLVKAMVQHQKAIAQRSMPCNPVT